MKINIVIEDKLGTILSCESVCEAVFEVSRLWGREDEYTIVVKGDEFLIKSWRSDALPPTPIQLPSDEEIATKYDNFIDNEITLGFLKQKQGERLKWYYKVYFIKKTQGGNK